VKKDIYVDDNISIFEREGSFFIRYDAGAHQVEIREDQISEEEASIAAKSAAGANTVLFGLQSRLIKSGVDPYKSNI